MEEIFDKESQTAIGSSLVMRHIVCDELSFERLGFRQKVNETKFSVSYGVEKDGEGEYRGAFVLSAKREEEYVATVKMTGYFLIDEDNPQKDVLLQKNGMAIIFPFARSQMTLLTSQPETMPVVMPVVDINKIVEQYEIEQEEEVHDEA